LPSVAECLKLSAKLEAVSDSARLDTELLLAHALNKDRTWLYTWPEKEIDQSAFELFKMFFERRLQGEPVAYIVGKKAFWSLDLLVNKTTLIPRPETELLVELALEKLPQQGKARVLDLGTGTGAIALAIAKERPDVQVLGVDFVPEAVVLAKENAKRNNVGNVEFLQSDWFSSVPYEKFDLIVSNPPYIDAADPHLNQGANCRDRSSAP
jgi:release factor glutamine methyltransferase